MSQENVEIMRRWVALANAVDIPGIIDLMAPDIKCFPADNEPEAASFSGREAFARRAEEANAAFDEHRVEVDEYIDLGDYVAVVARITAVGRISRAPVSTTEVWLCRFADGKVVEYRECSSKERALRAAGLSE